MTNDVDTPTARHELLAARDTLQKTRKGTMVKLPAHYLAMIIDLLDTAALDGSPDFGAKVIKLTRGLALSSVSALTPKKGDTK